MQSAQGVIGSKLKAQNISPVSCKQSANNGLAEKTGFSMIELMMAVSILGVIMTLAIPSLNQAIRNAQVRADSALLHAHLSFARRYALSNHTNVHLCQRPTSGALHCDRDLRAGRSWNTGWLVFADEDQNNAPNNNEIIKIVPALNSTNIQFNQRGRLRFFSDGSARSAGFYICAPNANSERYISILHSGRVRIRDKLPSSQQGLCKST